MAEYKIFTDSTTDLSAEMVADLELEIVPLEFTIAGKSYFNYPDGHEMSHKEFYSLLRAQNSSTTSQVNTSRFLEIFEPVLQEGFDIVYIAFSSGLSGTYNCCKLAAEELNEKYPNRKVYVIDSLAASMGEGLLVYHAVMQKRAGMTAEELAKWLEATRLHLCHWFTVDDLNHLKRGGRVSPAAALFGTMLGIKPVLHVDDEGHLIPIEKVRGRKASLDALVAHMEKTAIKPQDQTIFISHGDCLADAEYVAKVVQQKFKVKNVVINYIGPVIGAHSGPGTVALFFLGKQRL